MRQKSALARYYSSRKFIYVLDQRLLFYFIILFHSQMKAKSSNGKKHFECGFPALGQN